MTPNSSRYEQGLAKMRGIFGPEAGLHTGLVDELHRPVSVPKMRTAPQGRGNTPLWTLTGSAGVGQALICRGGRKGDKFNY